MSQLQKYQLTVGFCITLIIFITTAVYAPGLSGGFVFDDYSNILLPRGVRMQELSWFELKRAALSMDGRPITRATFGLNFLNSGFNPFYFKLINLVIHIGNAILIFFISNTLINALIGTQDDFKKANDSLWLAFFISIGWAVHPVNVTSVLYSVQRMNSLSATFVLLGILVYLHGRINYTGESQKPRAYLITACVLFTPLAWFSKENGALLPLYLFIIEAIVFRFKTNTNKIDRFLIWYYVIFLFAPTILAIIYINQNPGRFHQGYGNRYFSLPERILTQPRVIWSYINMIILPTYKQFGLFLDGVTISRSLTQPITTLYATAGLTGLTVVAFLSIRKLPIIALGLLLFLSGHLIESTIIPLELKFEHRNYLPSFGLIFILLIYLVRAQKHFITNNSAVYILLSLFIIYYGTITYKRSMDWSDNTTLYMAEVNNHPFSIRANYEAGKVYGQRLESNTGNISENYDKAIHYFSNVTRLRENSTSGLFGNILAAIDSNNQISSNWIDELAYRLEHHPLEQVNVAWLDKLTGCIIAGKCDKKSLQLSFLLDAATNNKYAGRKIKSMLYTIWSKYSYKVDNDIDTATRMARKSVKQQANSVPPRLNLAQFLILSGNYRAASREIDTAEKLDTSKTFSREIKAFRSHASSLIESHQN